MPGIKALALYMLSVKILEALKTRQRSEIHYKFHMLQITLHLVSKEVGLL